MISVLAAATAAAASPAPSGRGAGAVARAALLAWPGSYARISAPISQRLREAAARGCRSRRPALPPAALGERHPGRAGLQALVLAALLAVAVSH